MQSAILRQQQQLSLRSMRTFRTAAIVRSAQQPYVEGTVNDPTPFPAPNKAHGSYHWSFERAVSVALVPLVGATAMSSVHPVLDGLLGTALIVHSHMGFDALLVDYLHPRKFPTMGPVMKWVLRFATGGALVGLYQLETNDVGLVETCKRLWKGKTTTTAL